MINTIFYFVDSLSFNDYISQIRSGDISKKTIVFVDNTRSIFMGGKSYSYSDSSLRDEINHIQETITTLRENIEETISEINTDVQEVSELAQAQKDRLDTLLADLDDSIKDRIEQLFDDAQWIQQNFPQGVINWQSGWDDQIEAYLSRVGVWSRDNDITKTQWSNLIQSVNTLEGSVSSLTSTTNGLVTVSEGLDSRINLAINGKIAELNLGTTYAKINDVKGILEWMYSGLKSASSSSLSYNDLVTAAKNDQLGISAISEIRTSIENLGDTYAAKTEMNTLVNDSLASLIQAVDANQTLTGIINQLGTNTSNISSITSSIQAIEGAGYISQSQMLNALENELDGTTTTSSVKSKVDSVAKSAAATLFSSVADSNGNITAASVVAAVNGTDSSVTISADKIYMNGTTYTDYLVANYMTVGKLVNQLGNRQVVLENGMITVQSNDTRTLYVPISSTIGRKYVTPTGQIIYKIVDTEGEGTTIQEQIVIDGDAIYNIPMHGCTDYIHLQLSDQLVTPEWRLGFDATTFDQLGQSISVSQGESINSAMSFSVDIPSSEYYVFTTKRGKNGYGGGDALGSIYCDGNVIAKEKLYTTTSLQRESYVGDILYLNPTTEIAIHNGQSISSVSQPGQPNQQNLSAKGVNLDQYYIGQSTTLSLPAANSQHYELRFVSGILVSCNLVND